MLNALVTAVADAFSVMTTTERPYRFISHRPVSEALKWLWASLE